MCLKPYTVCGESKTTGNHGFPAFMIPSVKCWFFYTGYSADVIKMCVELCVN